MPGKIIRTEDCDSRFCDEDEWRFDHSCVHYTNSYYTSNFYLYKGTRE